MQALLGIGSPPIPLAGESYEKGVVIGIKRTCAAIAQRAGDVLLASHDGDFAPEVEVLVAVARGLTNHEVAAELYISLSTVKTHLGSLMGKLGVRNRVELALWAYQTRRLD